MTRGSNRPRLVRKAAFHSSPSFIHVIKAPMNIQLGKIPGSPKLCDEFRDEGEEVLVFDGDGVEGSVVLDQSKAPVLLFNEEIMKKTGEAIGDFEGLICPDSRFSLRKASSSLCSEGERG
jgi:hypothetical protein